MAHLRVRLPHINSMTTWTGFGKNLHPKKTSKSLLNKRGISKEHFDPGYHHKKLLRLTPEVDFPIQTLVNLWALKSKLCFLFLTLGNQNLFRQPLAINISFAINLEYNISEIANDLFYKHIWIIYMGKRLRNLRNIDRMFVDAKWQNTSIGMYLDSEINHLAWLILRQNIRHEKKKKDKKDQIKTL